MKPGEALYEMSENAFTKKGQVDSLNQEIAEYFYPQRADFNSDIVWGSEFGSHLMDFFPTLVRRELADQIGSMIRPSDRNWFKVSVGNPRVFRDTGAQSFMEFMTEVNRSVLYSRRSNFRRAATQTENDYSAFGMGHVHVFFSKDRGDIHYKNYHPRDCAIAEGDDGRVDHHYRNCSMTARGMLAEFKDEGKLPQVVQEALSSNDKKQTFKFRHCVVPVGEYEASRKFPKSAKFADVYVMDDGFVLKEIPAPTFDYVVPRWQTVSGHPYAFSPASIIALPQARMLQRMMLTLIESAERRVDPPLVAVDEVFSGPISLESGHVNYADSGYDERFGSSLRPIDLGKDVGLGDRLITDSRDLLSEAFFLNKLAPLANQDRAKTAYEASQLVTEYIRTALPLFEPLEDEWAGGILDLTTEKVMLAGGYGDLDEDNIPMDMPSSLQGAEIEFEYSNALREARDQQIVNGFMESSNLIAAAAQIDPATVAEVDTTTMFRDAFGAVPGNKVDWLVDKEEAAEAREQIEERMQAQGQAEMVGQGAEVATQVADAAAALQGAA